MKIPFRVTLTILTVLTVLVIGHQLSKKGESKDAAHSAAILTNTAPARTAEPSLAYESPSAREISRPKDSIAPPAAQQVFMPLQDNAALLAKADANPSKSSVFTFAEKIPVQITPANSGEWIDLPDGKSRWSLSIHSADATSINLGFTKYNMPDGGTLTISDPEGERDRFQFSSADNEAHGQLWTPVVEGADILIQVDLPKASKPDLNLLLASVNHGFREKNGAVSTRVSGSCNIDVVCGSGDVEFGAMIDLYRDQISSVARIIVGGTGVCSGALVNNTARDGRPFFLTAEHCNITAANAPSLVFYWNFENTACRLPGSPESGQDGNGDASQCSTGSIFRASNPTSDFCLVELDDPIPDSFNVYYAGWDRSGGHATSAVGIHHPNGSEKRICFEFDATQHFTSGSGKSLVRVNAWDEGTTEGGSSGSPLFDQNKRIIGQLFGGSSACGNISPDFYGRLDTSWTGSGATTRLSDWLDPLNHGVETLDGGFKGDLSCSYAISPTNANVLATGESGSVSLTVAAGCVWTAIPNDTWITLSSPSSGSGNATINYNIAANPSAIQRMGSITIGGQTFSITQAGVNCSYALNPSSQSSTSSGGGNSFSVTAADGCAWSASSGDDWITTSSSGNGDGSVSYSIVANTAATPRTGSISVADQTFTVTQSGVNCTYTLNPTSQDTVADGGSHSFSVSSPSGCAWNASSNEAWITTSSSGSGDGTVNYNVAANGTASARTGAITLGGQTFIVNQAGMAAEGYLGWANSNIPAGQDSAFDGDWDMDGIPNGVAYVFGETPINPVGSMPVGVVDGKQIGTGRLSAPPSIPDDVNVYLELSLESLNDWDAIITWEDGASPVFKFPNLTSIVENQVVDMGNQMPFFYRYRVTQR